MLQDNIIVMKYIIRAIKYFFYYIFLFVVILGALVLLDLTEGNIASMFKNGYDSLWQIALMFAAVASVYPLFGFMKKDAVIPGEYGQIRGEVVSYMEDKGYRLESEDGENLTFRLRSAGARIARMCEDRISFSRQMAGFRVEGLRKDVVRLVLGLEHKMREL